MSSVDAQKTTFNNWAKKIYDLIKDIVKKLVTVPISQKSVNGLDHSYEDSLKKLNLLYLKEVVQIVKDKSLNIARNKQARGKLTGDKIAINWWLEDETSYFDLKEMYGSHKIEWSPTDEAFSIVIVFRNQKLHWNSLRMAGLRVLHPTKPDPDHPSHRKKLSQLSKDEFTKLDLWNNFYFYEASEKIIDDYINCREIKEFPSDLIPKKTTWHKAFRKVWNQIQKSKPRLTDSSEPFPEHIIFQQIDVLFCDSDGFDLDLIERKFKPSNRSNNSQFFCEDCSEYFEVSEIPPWPEGFYKTLGDPDYQHPKDKLSKLLDNVTNKNLNRRKIEALKVKMDNFDKIVNQQMCPNGHSFPFILNPKIYSDLTYIKPIMNMHNPYNNEDVELSMLQKTLNYFLIIDGNSESQIKKPLETGLNYPNLDLRFHWFKQQMYRPYNQPGHEHNTQCGILRDNENGRDLRRKIDLQNPSSLQFLIEKMNEKDSIAISIVDLEEYSKISYDPKSKCQFNWRVIEFAIYEGKGKKPQEKCQCEDERHAGKPSHKYWKLDTNKHKFVCKYCGENYPGKSIVPYSKPRDINQPIKINHIMLGNE